MKEIIQKFLLALCIYILGGSYPLLADMFPKQDYQDFSTDRSTWFFKEKEGNIVFSDFYSPFDSTIKIKHFNPLVKFKLDNNYYFKNKNLMIEISDLKKLYDPYFDYKIVGNILFIKFTNYTKTIISDFGKRSTKLEYIKKSWEIKINLNSNNQKLSGESKYFQHKPVYAGRNKPFNNITELDFIKNKTFLLNNDFIDIKSNKYYISASNLMRLFNIKSFSEQNYTALQFEDIAYITSVIKDDKKFEFVIPKPSNTWVGGESKDYTWANYMDDIIDEKRNFGWLWQGIYIPSGDHFKDADGNKIYLDANRISVIAMYIPQNYDKNKTRLSYVMHGGTGNENTPFYRTMDRNNNLNEFAEKYNYILVSPNGWTQNPMWMQHQALYTFEKSFEIIMNSYPIDKNKIFIMGNSLGGRGTFDLGMRFPNLFKSMVVTAPAWGVRDYKKWIQKKYNLDLIKDMPILLGVGTADKTFSLKTQIGNKKDLGWIPKEITPHLNNATYISIEEGNHSQNWGSILNVIFDFFEEQIENKKQKIKTTKNIDYKIIDNIKFISIDKLKENFGDDLKVYKISSYDNDPKKKKDYFTIIYKRKSINIEIGNVKYRKNIERYKEDLTSKNTDGDFLDFAPKLSASPFVENECLYIPYEDIKVFYNN